MKSLILRTVVNHEPGDAVTYFSKTAAAASQLGLIMVTHCSRAGAQVTSIYDKDLNTLAALYS
jgi:hypothetical protein